MKNNEANIFVFIASIIIGIMISLNISFSNKNNINYLDAKQYEEAMIKKDNLLDDITNLNDQFNLNYAKLQKYQSSDTNNFKVIQEMNSELLQNKMNIGMENVHGPGIRITLKDGTKGLGVPDDIGLGYLVHNYDLVGIINDLKVAGAEAISINGNRLVSSSEVLCAGDFLQINNNQIWVPFTIDAIGNPNVLLEYLKRDGGLVDLMKVVRKIPVDIETKNDLEISAYNGSLSSKYLKSTVK